jgi:phage I-like protein
MSIAINFAGCDSELPTWVKLIGLGSLETRDNRGPFLVDDPAAIIALTRELSPDGAIVIDLDHATDLEGTRGRPAPAAGWATNFEIRDDGIFGKIDWTSLGKSALSRGPNGRRAYEFLSPVIEYDAVTHAVSAILRAGLVNEPNLADMAIATCSTRTRLAPSETEMTDYEKKIAKMMGVTDEQFTAAATSRAARNARSNEATFDIKPFVMSKLPAVRFVGLK